MLLAISAALVFQSTSAYIRVVDVGAGLCVVARVPSNQGYKYFIYDAGTTGATTENGIKDVIPAGAEVAQLTLSHTDADHAAAVKFICDTYVVKRILYPDYARNSDTWRDAVAAIEAEGQAGATLINPETPAAEPGTSWAVGGGTLTFVCGYNYPPGTWPLTSQGERNNAGSIVLKFTYAGKSVLICGDTVGRHIGDPPTTCIAAERKMVESNAMVPIDSNVLIAGHHGADNASSTLFIQTVRPRYVIFSAGHQGTFRHPRKTAALRILGAGIDITSARMFRTDRGDDEGPDEWDYLRVGGISDTKGDDDVEIRLPPSAATSVRYR